MSQLASTAFANQSEKAIGPILGHVDDTNAIIWYRPAEAGEYQAEIYDENKKKVDSRKAVASTEHDLCVKWTFKGLMPDRTYHYRITNADQTLAAGEQYHFNTAVNPDKPSTTTLTFGSCASSTDFFDVWKRIASEGTDGLVLMGDTPYIDRSALAFNRNRHRQFISMPPLQVLCANTPLWDTWDDHDFGGNDTDGRVKDKKAIRQVVTEYRAQLNYGENDKGIYTKFRRGPVEVFMIDARYFAQTEKSPFDESKPTGLGKQQWDWFLSGLKASTAPFKVLLSGMIWDDKKNREKDDWHTYAHEREYLFDFIGKEKIKGVILLSGDIHVSRHLKYPMKERIGYDLHQFISSPLHNRIIPSLNVPHPNLVWGEPIPNIFLRIEFDSTASTPTLKAKWIDIKGKVHYETSVEFV